MRDGWCTRDCNAQYADGVPNFWYTVYFIFRGIIALGMKGDGITLAHLTESRQRQAVGNEIWAL